MQTSSIAYNTSHEVSWNLAAILAGFKMTKEYLTQEIKPNNLQLQLQKSKGYKEHSKELY